MIKVSVIIPVYNTEKYIGQCLDSVINQTLKELEIICVNDGSTDGSLDILREYAKKDSRIIIIDKENTSAGDSRNKGLDIAQGEYLYFLDSDDFIEEDMFSQLYDFSMANNADITIFDYNFYYEDCAEFERVHHRELPKHVFSYSDVIEDVFDLCQPMAWFKFYKRDFIKKNNIFFQNIKGCNDIYFDLSARVLAERIGYLDSAFVNYRINRKDSLASVRCKTAHCIFQVANELRRMLLEYGLYDKVEISYYKKFAALIKYLKSRCSGFYLAKFFLNYIFVLNIETQKKFLFMRLNLYVEKIRKTTWMFFKY